MSVRRIQTRLCFISLAILAGAAAQPALACSTCLSGDPTLTVMGAEKPYEGRARFSAQWLARNESMGIENFNERDLDERRMTLGLAYALNPRWLVSVSLPIVSKEMTTANLARESTSAAGDLELGFKYFAGRDREFNPRHLYGLLLGMQLPTGEEQSLDGAALDFDVQPGTGATVLKAGAWYGHYRFPWMLYGSAVWNTAGEGYANFQAGDALNLSLTAQYGFGYTLAMQGGLDLRWSDYNRFDGERDPDSGGTLAYATLGLVANAARDLVLNINLQLPAVDALNGDHEESATLRLGMTYDF